MCQLVPFVSSHSNSRIELTESLQFAFLLIFFDKYFKNNNNFQKYFELPFLFEIIFFSFDIYGFSFLFSPMISTSFLPRYFTIFFRFFSSRLLPCLNSLNSSSTNISMKSTFYLCPPHLKAADEPLTFVTQFVQSTLEQQLPQLDTKRRFNQQLFSLTF